MEPLTIDPGQVALIEELQRFESAGRRPNRVVYTYDGGATSPSKAALRGVYADTVFIRADGWSLGAPSRLEGVAYGLWPREWSYVYNYATRQYVSIEVYRVDRDIRKILTDAGVAHAGQ